MFSFFVCFEENVVWKGEKEYKNENAKKIYTCITLIITYGCTKKIIIKNWLNPVFFLCNHYTKGNVIKINKLFCTLFSDQKVKIS